MAASLPPSVPQAPAQPLIRAELRFDQREWSGAFGDLGTLVPFLFAYVTIVGMAPAGMLLAFGIALIIAGAWFRTPFPVQPMKAIGAIAVTGAVQTAVVTPQAVAVAALVTGLIWLLLGATGTTERIVRFVGRPVIVGITLGLGFAFMLEGTRMMAGRTLACRPATHRHDAPALESRLARHVPDTCRGGGVGGHDRAGDCRSPWSRRDRSSARLHWPFQGLTWEAVFVGIVLLALPQVPLTLGNAVIAPVEYNNREFPDRPVTARQVAISTGVMNTLGSLIGAVPMCHGAGGMAAQVSFGARTGGAPIILGALLIILALLFSESIETLLRLFPQPALGVMLFLAGLQLALGSCDFSKDKGERFVTLGTAALSVWNVGVAFVFGLGVLWLVRRGWLKL